MVEPQITDTAATAKRRVGPTAERQVIVGILVPGDDVMRSVTTSADPF
jgi:hypothetical protein